MWAVAAVRPPAERKPRESRVLGGMLFEGFLRLIFLGVFNEPNSDLS